MPRRQLDTDGDGVLRRLLIWSSGCLLLLVPVIGTAGEPGEHSASEALRLLREQVDRPLPPRFTARSKLTWPTGAVSCSFVYRGDPQRWVVRSSAFSARSLQGASILLHGRRTVLSGGNWLAKIEGAERVGHDRDMLIAQRFQFQAGGEPRSTPRYELRASGSASAEPRQSLGRSAMAFGYLLSGTAEHLWSLHSEERVSVQSAQEELDGRSTVVLRFDSPNGVRTLWLDPRQGMLPRQVEIRQAPPSGAIRQFETMPTLENLFIDEVVAASRTRYHAFEIRPVGGRPMIVGFRADFETSGPRGEPVVASGEYSIEDIEMEAPSLSEEDLDAEIDIPDRTSVQIQGERGDANVWINGSDGSDQPGRKRGRISRNFAAPPRGAF